MKNMMMKNKRYYDENIKWNNKYIYDLLDDELWDYTDPFPNHEDEMMIIKHPFYSSNILIQNNGVLNIEDQINLINKSFHSKMKVIEKCKEEGEWYWLLTSGVEKPYRFSEFVKYQNKLTDKEYWGILGEIFTSTEQQSNKMFEWISLLKSNRPKRENLMMEDEDLDFFNQLPNKVEVWRGVNDEDYVMGLSWTTDKEQGEWFSKRIPTTHRENILCNGWIEKDKILMSSQHENLIVCNPTHITDLNIQIL